MKRWHRWVIVCACVVVGGGAAGLALRLWTGMAPSRLKLEFASELDPSDPRYKEVMCGPVSLSVALGRLGVSSSPSDLASQCKVISQGVALRDLQHAANSIRRVKARARRLDWDGLTRLDGVAVLHVQGDHYLAVDPREVPQSATRTATVRIYEPGIPAQWWTREELEEIWAGETLVIIKGPTPADEARDGACLDWDECFVDQGILRDTPIARYRFRFRNDGGSDLVIGKIQTSCGCIEHKLSQRRLAPGESGVIEVDVNLNRSEGYIRQQVAVPTNDAANAVSILRMAGGVPRSRVVSNDVIRLKDLPLGGRISREFHVADPGFRGFRIRETRFVAHGSARIGEQLSCSISHELIGEDAERVRSLTGFRVKPSDYVVRLSLEASKACPLGPFQGEVSVVLEADDDLRTHKVVIGGTIVQDVRPVPRLALITLGPEDAGSATVQLHSYSKQDFRVVKTWCDSGNSLTIGPEGDSQPANSRYTITVHDSDMIAGSAPLKRAAFFELDDGSVVSVPVAVFRPPQ